MKKLSKILFICTLCIITVSGYAYTIKNGKFVSSNSKLSFTMPNSALDLATNEIITDVLTVNIVTNPYEDKPFQLVVVSVPLDQRHYPHFEKFPIHHLKKSLPFRIKLLAKNPNLKNIQCKDIKVNNDNAYQCKATILNPATKIPIVMIGTLFFKGQHVIHVYGIEPQDHTLNINRYNDFVRSVDQLSYLQKHNEKYE